MKLKPETSISRGAANKIKKNKSLEKRLEVFEEIFSTILNEDKSIIASLLIEKAKYGEHFTQVLAAIGRLDFPGSKEVVLGVAAKCTEDPAQSGCAMVVLNGLGRWRGHCTRTCCGNDGILEEANRIRSSPKPSGKNVSLGKSLRRNSQ